MEEIISQSEEDLVQGAQVQADQDSALNTADSNQTDTVQDEEDAVPHFEDLGLDEVTLEAIRRKGFVTPSPIQILAIPRLLNGEANVIAKARTGTGKTAAFGLPLVQRLREKSDHVRAIILEPTRELAQQTCTEMSSFTTGSCPRNTVVYGGASMGEQIRALKKGVEIVTGTPGRVQDLIERGVLDISKIDYFILDEGDEMLDMGFIDDIENIFSFANPDCRVLLFSATVPREILKIAQKFMGDYEIVEEEAHEEEPLLIEQRYWVVRESEKVEALIRLIDISSDFYGLVFVQRKTDADAVMKALDEKGYMVAALHGDIPQGQREKILARFRAKRIRILVATDVAARGIDIGGLTHVVNYDLPTDGPTYVHRIGRTGRAGAEGMAVTFVRPEESRRKLSYLRQAIRRSAKGEMNEGKVPSVEEVIESKKKRLFNKVKEQLGLTDGERSANVEDGQEAPVPHLRKGDEIFDKMAEELCLGQNPQEVVSSLLAATYGKSLSAKNYGKINDMYGRGERERAGRTDKGPRISVAQNQIRIYAQMGWTDGYSPKSIAEFFSNLLGIRNHDVDAIDMADKFCLLTLPKEAGERALDLSKEDSSLPHMHVDSKSVSRDDDDFGGRGRRGSRGRGSYGRDRGRSRRFGNDRYAVGRDRDDRRGSDDRHGSSRSSKARSFNHTRPNVHTATQRSGGGFASLFKKGGADEY